MLYTILHKNRANLLCIVQNLLDVPAGACIRTFICNQIHQNYVTRPIFCPQVGIAGVPIDSVMKKTKALENQWVPVWNQEFEFPLTVPEMALLRMEVYNYNISKSHDFAGQTCLPLWELKTGIRSVPLHNRKGEMYRSVRVLMRFDFVS